MTIRYRLVAALMCLAAAAAGSAFGADTGSLRVGAAKVDISPPATFFPYPPGRAKGAFVGVHDPLYARAIFMDNGSSQLAVVVMDLIRVPNPQELSKEVAGVLGIAPERLMMAATHNHIAPNPFLETYAEVTAYYYDVVRPGVLEAARRAKSSLQPARIGFGTGKAYINANRDQLLGDRYGLGFNPERPSDKTVAVVKFESPSGDPIAIFVNYAVHPVLMFTALTKGEQKEVTADIAGATCRLVEEFYKGKPVAVWTMGAAGDQNPEYTAASMSPGFPPGFPRYDTGAGGYALLEVQARRLAEEVYRVSTGTKATMSDARLWGGQKTVTCPGQRMTRIGNTWNYKTEQTAPVEIPLNLLMVGDIALAGIGGEVVSVIGERFKKASPFPKTVMITRVGDGRGDGLWGYIPDDASYPLRTFEVTGSPLQAGCAEPAINGGWMEMMKSYSALGAHEK